MCTKLPTIQFLPKAPSPSIMGINLQTSQRQKASCDKIGGLDEENGGNGGEAGCEKRAPNGAGRTRERNNRGARSGRLGNAAKELA